MIANVIPGYEGVGELDRTRDEFHVPGRALCRHGLASADGLVI